MKAENVSLGVSLSINVSLDYKASKNGTDPSFDCIFFKFLIRLIAFGYVILDHLIAPTAP